MILVTFTMKSGSNVEAVLLNEEQYEEILRLTFEDKECSNLRIANDGYFATVIDTREVVAATASVLEDEEEEDDDEPEAASLALSALNSNYGEEGLNV